MTRIKFSKCDPLPAYDGPTPVYRATFPWAGAVDCYVRKGPQGWETAQVGGYLQNARFSICPVAQAADTRAAAVYAFDYYFNRGLQDSVQVR
jgi:hypothetical protein